MSFIADKQTLEDLNLLGKYRPNSIFGLFNQTKTHGGGRLLEGMFQEPLTDPDRINARRKTFQYFQDKRLKFPFSTDAIGLMENYISMGARSHFFLTAAGILQKKLLSTFVRDERYGMIYSGLLATIQTLHALRSFIRQLESEGDSPYQERVRALKDFFADRRLDWLSAAARTESLPILQVAKYDHLLKHTFSKEMEGVMEAIYELDLYIAVTDVARSRNFSYALALPKGRNLFKAIDLRHPGLDKAVGNPLSLHGDSNVVFLTGANMAGKSTFMKSFGISLYLGHMGFPVAAKKMEFSVRDGLYSSINVPDNLSLGLSHFYAEVLRVKTVAEEVSSGKDLVVIFDELFKGTNVKDAYDATLAVTEAFSEYRNCFFIISTHIIEVGDALRQRRDNLQFSYLPTIMEGTIPRYPYRLEEGITNDRHGMMIIANEKILEIILS